MEASQVILQVRFRDALDQNDCLNNLVTLLNCLGWPCAIRVIRDGSHLNFPQLFLEEELDGMHWRPDVLAHGHI